MASTPAPKSAVSTVEGPAEPEVHFEDNYEPLCWRLDDPGTLHYDSFVTSTSTKTVTCAPCLKLADLPPDELPVHPDATNPDGTPLDPPARVTD